MPRLRNKTPPDADVSRLVAINRNSHNVDVIYDVGKHFIRDSEFCALTKVPRKSFDFNIVLIQRRICCE
jgi:hypothetical protein